VPLKYDQASDTFTGTMSQMVKLAMRAVQELGWKLDNANESLGLVTFETGMSWGSWSGISCSLNIEEAGENRFRVTGTGKQNVRGGQFVAPNFFGEAQGRAAKAINKMKELAPQEVGPQILGSTTICGSCGAQVHLAQKVCDLCGGPLTVTGVPAPNNVGGTASLPIVSAPAPAKYRVIVEHVGPSRRQALAQIIHEENDELEDATIKAVCEQPSVAVASGLSLERANALMMRLHDQGLLPRKEREADR